MSLQRRARTLALATAVPLLAGCSIAPKSFRKMNDAAPIVRARAVGLAEGLPAEQAVPTLIKHLDDPDPVVRMAAAEELRKHTGQTLGFLPWGPEAERAEAGGPGGTPGGASATSRAPSPSSPSRSAAYGSPRRSVAPRTFLTTTAARRFQMTKTIRAAR